MTTTDQTRRRTRRTGLARPVDVNRAQVARGGDGSVSFDDGGPWVVRIWTQTEQGRVHLTRLQVDVRDPLVALTAARLGRLPVGQMLHIAALHNTDGSHPNELYYRMLATPKPSHSRGWDDDHWQRVLDVYTWAVRTGRPGGGRRAVADLWGVSINPTVHRWMGEARRRAAGQAAA